MQKNTSYHPIEVWGGIECTINRVQDDFFDQLTSSGHYDRIKDLEQIAKLGIKKIRYPILWEKHQPQRDTPIDWSWTKERLQFLQQKNIDVIAGLVHHGSGPAYTNMLDEKFPYLLAAYARKVAAAFPWINYYIPVNEPLITARFSGLYGVWYPHHRDDRSFLIMLLHELKGVVLSMQEIRKINPNAKLVQTEDLGKTYSTPKLQYQANFENERRWLTYDLLCGRVDKLHPLWKYFKKCGIPEQDVLFFRENPCVPDLFGFNHYVTSERFLDERLHLYPAHLHGGNEHHHYVDTEAVRVEVEDETGIDLLIEEAWDRYGQPIAITEVHLHCHREEQLRWFQYVWKHCSALKEKGVQIEALTAWALLGSYGWNKLLQERGGDYEPGVFDLRSGKPRPTALAAFIRKLNAGHVPDHHLAGHKGWWHRNDRFLHPPIIEKKYTEVEEAIETRPLMIIGKTGTLGQAFARICDRRNIPYILTDRQQCDIVDIRSIESAIDLYQPWAIINTAGYVRVDDAEFEKEKCFRENSVGVHNLALACKRLGVRLVTFSSDLVFDGKKKTPYLEEDEVYPLNTYGLSKAESEHMVLKTDPGALVIRTSAFFGPWDTYNFISWVMNSLSQQQPVSALSDITISPTYVPDLVHATLDLLIDEEQGIWHLANEGSMTWAELAYETARQMGLDASLIQAVTQEDMNLPATRPHNSVLGSSRGMMLPSLENALQRFFDEKKVLVNF